MWYRRRFCRSHDMRYCEIFWDFDGTLFDTYPRITRAFLHGLEDAGIRTDYETAFTRVKVSLGNAAQVYAGEAGIAADLLSEGYRRHAEDEGIEGFRMFPDTKETLQRIVAAGGHHYLYTHRGETALPALEHAGIIGLFRDAVTGKMGFPIKPCPEALQYLMGQWKLSRKDCLMVGDRVIDVQAGLNAGMAGVLLDPDGLCPDMPEVYRCRDMKEFAQWLFRETE